MCGAVNCPWLVTFTTLFCQPVSPEVLLLLLLLPFLLSLLFLLFCVCAQHFVAIEHLWHLVFLHDDVCVTFSLGSPLCDTSRFCYRHLYCPRCLSWWYLLTVPTPTRTMSVVPFVSSAVTRSVCARASISGRERVFCAHRQPLSAH